MTWAKAAAGRYLRPGMAMRRVQLALLYIFRKRPNVQVMLHAPPAVGKSFIYLCWSAQLGPRPGKVVIVLEPTVELAKNQVAGRLCAAKSIRYFNSAEARTFGDFVVGVIATRLMPYPMGRDCRCTKSKRIGHITRLLH